MLIMMMMLIMTMVIMMMLMMTSVLPLISQVWLLCFWVVADSLCLMSRKLVEHCSRGGLNVILYFLLLYFCICLMSRKLVEHCCTLCSLYSTVPVYPKWYAVSYTDLHLYPPGYPVLDVPSRKLVERCISAAVGITFWFWISPDPRIKWCIVVFWLCLMSGNWLMSSAAQGGFWVFGGGEFGFLAWWGESAEMSKFLFPLPGSAAPSPSNSYHVINRLITYSFWPLNSILI